MEGPFPNQYYSTCKVDVNELLRWVPDAKNSFLNRLQWSVKSPQEVNHEPVAAIGKDSSNKIIRMKVKPGKTIRLDASKSSDPDGNQLSYNWFFYKNASSYTGTVLPENEKNAVLNLKVPNDLGENDIHLILEVRDNGNPSLVNYRRVILTK